MSAQHQSAQWLSLRWQHCYQWKNLLDAERASRQLLDAKHQQQLTDLFVAEKLNQTTLVVRSQLVALLLLRQGHQQERLRLRERQAQEMTALKGQTAQESNDHELGHFEILSVLRQK